MTVEDTATKKGMDLRLLHAVAYGQTWFGRLGYNLRHGSFGITGDRYQQAVEALSSIKLEKLVQDLGKAGRDRAMKRIISTYQKSSAARPLTLGDLLRRMLDLKASVPMGGTKKLATVDGRWSARRIERAAEVVVEALRAARGRGWQGMSRQELRDAARLHVRDTGLLDFVLKSLGGCVVGVHLVRRAHNPATRVLEFSLQEVGGVPACLQEELERDVWYVYRQVFDEYPAGEMMVRAAVQVVRDCKHFSKTWPFVVRWDDGNLRLFCGVIADASDMEVLPRGVPACELVVLPPGATVGDLMKAGEEALRDTYLVMDRFAVRSVDGAETEGQELLGMVESGETVWLRGSGLDRGTGLKYEGGADGWTVDCKCGAVDDDGERMVACDVCEVWQHTWCAGYSDAEFPPKAYWCEPCCVMLDPRRSRFSSSSSSSATCAAAASRFVISHDAYYLPSALHF